MRDLCQSTPFFSKQKKCIFAPLSQVATYMGNEVAQGINATIPAVSHRIRRRTTRCPMQLNGDVDWPRS